MYQNRGTARQKTREKLLSLGIDLAGKHVHHIDGNPFNDSLDNLSIVSPSEHHAAHNEDMKAAAQRASLHCKYRSIKPIQWKSTQSGLLECLFCSAMADRIFQRDFITLPCCAECAEDLANHRNDILRYAWQKFTQKQ